jgi:hypothetical protein
VEGSGEPNLVQGINCSAGHFNDPRSVHCATCGLPIADSDRVVVAGERPALGVLVAEGVEPHVVSRDVIIGRYPHEEPEVIDGLASPYELKDPSASRIHARLVLHGWDLLVADAGSTNGTKIATGGASEWSAVATDAWSIVEPGAYLCLGRVIVHFESNRRLT